MARAGIGPGNDSQSITIMRHIPGRNLGESAPAPQAACSSIIYVDSGNGSCVVDGVPMGIDACNLLWLPAGCIWESIDMLGAGWWQVTVGGNGLKGVAVAEQLLERLSPVELPAAPNGTACIWRKYTVGAGDGMVWGMRLEQLQQELEHHRLGADEAAAAVLQLMLIDIVRLAHQPQSFAAVRRSPVVESVAAFIEKKFTAPIGLADVARAVSRSPSYLTDLVRRETGQTVLQWIIARRMREACALLLATDLCVKDICTRIGYDDPGHFIRQFRRAHNATPQCWRRLQRGARPLLARRRLPPVIGHAAAEFIDTITDLPIVPAIRPPIPKVPVDSSSGESMFSAS